MLGPHTTIRPWPSASEPCFVDPLSRMFFFLFMAAKLPKYFEPWKRGPNFSIYMLVEKSIFVFRTVCGQRWFTLQNDESHNKALRSAVLLTCCLHCSTLCWFLAHKKTDLTHISAFMVTINRSHETFANRLSTVETFPPHIHFVVHSFFLQWLLLFPDSMPFPRAGVFSSSKTRFFKKKQQKTGFLKLRKTRQ